MVSRMAVARTHTQLVTFALPFANELAMVAGVAELFPHWHLAPPVAGTIDHPICLHHTR